MISLTFSVFSVDILNDEIRVFTDNAALLIDVSLCVCNGTVILFIQL